MNYDVWGSWSPSVGPNAPLDDSCTPSPRGSAKSAVKAWTGAGFPVNKIILGVPAYGHSYHVGSSNAFDASGKLEPYVPFDKSQQPMGDKWDSSGTAGGVDVCGKPNVAGPDGIFNFWGLIDGGFLTENGTVAKGIDYTFDQCSQTVSDQQRLWPRSNRL
jgi:chitinase